MLKPGASVERITPELQTMKRDADAWLSGAKTAGWLFPLTHWNWKVAMVTAVLRGLACVAALRHMEVHARDHFGVVEAAFVLLTCGVLLGAAAAVSGDSVGDCWLGSPVWWWCR